MKMHSSEDEWPEKQKWRKFILIKLEKTGVWISSNIFHFEIKVKNEISTYHFLRDGGKILTLKKFSGKCLPQKKKTTKCFPLKLYL